MKFLLIFFIIINTFVFAGRDKGLEKVSLQLHWKYQFEFAGFIAAKEKGFYKDVGLDVALKEYEFGQDIEKDILSGKSEYGIYNSLSLLEYLRGKELVLISSYFKRAALVLVTTPDIKSPKDLVGKRVMATTKEDFILNFKPYFDSYGVNIDDIILVPHSYGVSRFANGEVSAITAFVSNELHKLDVQNIAYNVLDPSDENFYVLQLELVTSKNEALNHPKRVSAFKKASLRGWEYALSHKEEIVDIIYNKYSKKYKKDTMMLEARSVEKLILPYTYSIGSIDKNFLQKQVELLKSEYKTEKNRKLNEFIFHGSNNGAITFSSEEFSYILDAQAITICTRYDKFPIDGYINGEFVGIMSDIYKEISQRTSLEFKVIESKSVKELEENVKNGKCKILSIVGTKSKRFPNIMATNPFASLHFTLVSTLDKSFVSNPYTLRNKVLVTQEKIFKQYLEKLYPFLTIQVQTDKKKMMKMLLNEEVYAIFTLDERVDYLIEELGYGKVKINGFLAQEKPIDVSIGVNEAEPILYSIMQKALGSFSSREITKIINSWKMTRYHSVTDYTMVYIVLSFMSLIIFVMFYYNAKQKHFNKELEKQVNAKTKKLRKINDFLEETVAQKVEELFKKDEILTIQSKQAVMGEMISMIAHQWRQPLNTITLNISNLQIKKMLNQEIDAQLLDKTLNDITETIVYLSETIDDFKTYFHPDKKSELVNISELVNKAVNFVLPRIKSEKIEINMQESSNLKAEVYPNELIQVLLNILNNAIDAHVSKDTQNKFININVVTENEELLICIKDNAGGIPSAYIGQLFEPYFSTKGKNGTGLGLYMSQMIMQKQFKGKIDVEVDGSSSSFIVRFPIVPHA